MNHQEVIDELANAGSWQKSSHSDLANNCVEITTELPGWVGIRDSKLGDNSPILAFTHGEWDALVQGVRDGEFGTSG